MTDAGRVKGKHGRHQPTVQRCKNKEMPRRRQLAAATYEGIASACDRQQRHSGSQEEQVIESVAKVLERQACNEKTGKRITGQMGKTSQAGFSHNAGPSVLGGGDVCVQVL